MSEGSDDTDKLRDDAAKRPFNPDGGEDEASTSHDGNDEHLHKDQKPENGRSANDAKVSDEVGEDDPNKAEKLTKAGRDIDPNEGAD